MLSERELDYVSSQRLGRLATSQPDGTLQVSPVGFFRNVADNGRVAFVVDDVPSVDPWRVRCLEIRGYAEAIPPTGDTTGGVDGALIRIHPERIISFGIDEPDQAPHEMTANNRDVASE